MQKYYIFLNLGPAAGPAQANTTVLQLPIIETRAEVLLGLARADVSNPSNGTHIIVPTAVLDGGPAGFNSHRQRSTLAAPARYTLCPGRIRRRKFEH